MCPLAGGGIDVHEDRALLAGACRVERLAALRRHALDHVHCASRSSTSTAPAKAAKLRALSACRASRLPSASTTSYSPRVTIAHAWCNAVEDDAQAFSTLTTGILPIPSSRNTTCPRMHSWPVTTPAAALPTRQPRWQPCRYRHRSAPAGWPRRASAFSRARGACRSGSSRRRRRMHASSFCAVPYSQAGLMQRHCRPFIARTSLPPSAISIARASRNSFSIGYSRVMPLPPKICSASLATSKAVCVAVTLADDRGRLEGRVGRGVVFHDAAGQRPGRLDLAEHVEQAEAARAGGG